MYCAETSVLITPRAQRYILRAYWIWAKQFQRDGSLNHSHFECWTFQCCLASHFTRESARCIRVLQSDASWCVVCVRDCSLMLTIGSEIQAHTARLSKRLLLSVEFSDCGWMKTSSLARPSPAKLSTTKCSVLRAISRSSVWNCGHSTNETDTKCLMIIDISDKNQIVFKKW